MGTRVVAMVAAMAMPVAAALAAFLQREFLAHADIKFAHDLSFLTRPPRARGRIIIIKSSNVNIRHQKIIKYS
jgi:hypothetical protein